MSDRIQTYTEFYAFYLSEHQNKTSRMLHCIGTFLAFVLIGIGIYNHWTWNWCFIPIIGYGFAWVGHAFFEKNKPATFQYPLWSLYSDVKLFFEIVFRKRSLDSTKD